MLSFLPVQDVVRTCVLAKCWRNLWKSTTVLRFDFVDQLLRLRICEGTPLDTCEFCLGENDDGEIMSRVMHWIRIALQCKVRVLQLICAGNCRDILSLDGHPFFISQYLKKLELNGIYFRYALLISSQCLKCLTIEIGAFGEDDRLPIYAPNLVSLWLEVRDGRIPMLERMPSLLAAYVKIDSDFDCIFNSDSEDDDDGDDDGDNDNQSILLQGLSEVRNLVLISCYIKMFIFRRDLRFCSSFKLKSLLVDEYWCQPADFSALACLLKLSLVLEKLTLQIYSEGHEHKVEIKLSCKPLEMSTAISQHLKTLEVKCEVYDERINKLLTFLSKQLNIYTSEISRRPDVLLKMFG
ncbi:hypothetical protein BDA96_05G074200 [Sorghum bicolor]|uniref:F-box domain-containing protein n=1 Tax=Sorghum bicolor TaxID=4558 RepID=A0A921QWS6_SORBI|nr:hypothetical protein BDA96_05G074200 [Sorghum bicolor]